MAEKENLPQELPHKPQQGNADSPGKSTWPELVGFTAEEAEKKIKEETPAGTQVHVVTPDLFLTMDIRTDRVRIFVDSSGKVVKPPKIA